MRDRDRKALARMVNDMGDALGDAPANDVTRAELLDQHEALREAVSEYRERLELLLLRDKERDDGPLLSARVKLERGSGVRDSDQWTLRAEGRTFDETEERMDALLERYEEDWGPRARALDPGEE